MMRFSQNRLFTIALAVFFVFTVVFAGAFVFLHLSHDHTGGDCLVCLQIKTLQNLLKGFLPAAVFFLLSGARAGAPKGSQYSGRFLPDPVLLKVRFNT
jgi:hypothetical protein